MLQEHSFFKKQVEINLFHHSPPPTFAFLYKSQLNVLNVTCFILYL